MKKIFAILVALGIVSTMGTVIACAADETEPETTAAQSTEPTTEEKANDITTTENVENISDAPESSVPEASESDKEPVSSDIESGMETEKDAKETLKNESEAEESTDNTKNVEKDSQKDVTADSIPNTGEKRNIFPLLATLLLSGVTAAYCVVKGKKSKKTKADGE